jgi:hypothetical protein
MPWRDAFSGRAGAGFPKNLHLGVGLYTNGHPWHAHEVWEELWRDASGKDRPFLQGLIQLAGARYHAMNANPHGVMALLGRSQKNLGQVSGDHLGLDLGPVRAFLKDVLSDRNNPPQPEHFPPLALAGS